MTPDADRFWAMLRQLVQPKHTAKLSHCWDALRVLGNAYDPSISERRRLHALLDELCREALIRLPSPDNAAMWNREASPSLPLTIGVVRKQLPAATDDGWERRVWHEATAWLADVPGARRYAIEIAQIERFLREGGSQRSLMPMNERSAEVFGDEKRLADLRSGILFASGQLDLERHLRCRPIPPPIPWERAGGNGEPLIVENTTTYWSLCRWNRLHLRWCAVICGCGNQVTGQIDTLVQLAEEERWTRYSYFGDLDPAGVDIPISLTAGLARSAIALTPENELYRLLLDRRKRWQQRRSASADAFGPLTRIWLGALADDVAALFASGGYAPQELVTIDVLEAWSRVGTEP